MKSEDIASWQENYDKSRQHVKSRDVTLLTKVHIVKAMVFHESWTMKAEHGRIDVFKLWCWRRLLRVPWTARRSNQLILKKSNPEYSLEGLTLKVPVFWSLDMNSRLTGKVSDAGKD